MISCDWHDISLLIGNLTYTDICFNNGLNVNFRTAIYKNQKLNFIEGRGYIHPLSLLDKLKIEYTIIDDIEYYMQQNSLDKCILYAPLEIIENAKYISTLTTQLSFVYSSFAVKKNASNQISLLVGSGILEKKFDMELEDFLKLFALNSVPLQKCVFFIEIKNNTSNLTKEEMFYNCKKSFQTMLSNEVYTSDQMRTESGLKAYSSYIHYLHDDDFINNNKLSYIKRFINASIINSGSQAFYRYDFFYSLKQFKLINSNSYTETLFIELISLWRKNCRLFRKISSRENNLPPTIINDISFLLRKIQQSEMQLSELILENF